jgi:hypothetical protein
LNFIFDFMANLIKLTLSFRDTLDSMFSHGPSFESVLNEYLPHLRQFDYSMTRKIVSQDFIEHCIQRPMNFVFYVKENCNWIHIYSFP